MLLGVNDMLQVLMTPRTAVEHSWTKTATQA